MPSARSPTIVVPMSKQSHSSEYRTNQFKNTNLPKKILLIRLDRIGDLVLTLPVDESLTNTTVHWWIPPGLSFITEHANPPRKANEVGRKFLIRNFLNLLNLVKSENYDAAIVFQAPWWIGLLLFLARVPLRGGVKSKWFSFLFFNRAIRQKRSRAEVNELEYNFQLVEKILNLAARELPRTHLHLHSSTPIEALAKFHLKQNQYMVVHPGMGGSALNWPTKHYIALIRELAKKTSVVITGTATDESYLEPIQKELKADPNINWLVGKCSGKELIAVLAGSQHVIAPSTGVLHLAASTGTSTIGIFSPIQVQHPRRWGPQGKKIQVLLPDVQCPGIHSCLGKSCPHFNCMDTISVIELLNKIESQQT